MPVSSFKYIKCAIVTYHTSHLNQMHTVIIHARWISMFHCNSSLHYAFWSLIAAIAEW